ncbi:MAG: response regulator [Candidatus Omnitrophica bacterium]|nr:response regulator [Candidatus Omnitrophota bacterium]
MANKILVVDDEASVRDLFAELLKKEDCAVTSVSSAEDALNLVEKESFDAVLMDIKLPGMSGMEALKKMKDKFPLLPVIMITGFGYDENLIAKCKEYSCNGYIGKNMPISQIISSFKMFLKTAKEKK